MSADRRKAPVALAAGHAGARRRAAVLRRSRPVAELGADELAWFEQILDLPDPELYAYLTGRSAPEDPAIAPSSSESARAIDLRPEPSALAAVWWLALHALVVAAVVVLGVPLAAQGPRIALRAAFTRSRCRPSVRLGSSTGGDGRVGVPELGLDDLDARPAHPLHRELGRGSTFAGRNARFRVAARRSGRSRGLAPTADGAPAIAPERRERRHREVVRALRGERS